MTYRHFSPLTDPKINWERVDHDALRMLDEAREIAGIPFRVTSTYREGPQHLAHGETPCTAFDLGYSQHEQTREWVTLFQYDNPGTFAKGKGRQTYRALDGLLYMHDTGRDYHLFRKDGPNALPDGIRIILACMKAGFPRIGIRLGPDLMHIHVDCSPIQLKKTGKVVFVE